MRSLLYWFLRWLDESGCRAATRRRVAREQQERGDEREPDYPQPIKYRCHACGRDYYPQFTGGCCPACDPVRSELPTEQWCPAHDRWYGAEAECDGCRAEFEASFQRGEEPDTLEARAAWEAAEEQRALAESDLTWPSEREIADYDAEERAEREDGAWYLDRIQQAQFGGHPGDDEEWRGN